MENVEFQKLSESLATQQHAFNLSFDKKHCPPLDFRKARNICQPDMILIYISLTHTPSSL